MSARATSQGTSQQRDLSAVIGIVLRDAVKHECDRTPAAGGIFLELVIRQAGKPDLHGFWTNATVSRMDRPNGYPLILTDEQAAQLEGRAAGTPLAQQAQLDRAYAQYKAGEQAQAAEDARLLYVGLTRARDALWLATGAFFNHDKTPLWPMVSDPQALAEALPGRIALTAGLPPAALPWLPPEAGGEVPPARRPSATATCRSAGQSKEDAITSPRPNICISVTSSGRSSTKRISSTASG